MTRNFPVLLKLIVCLLTTGYVTRTAAQNGNDRNTALLSREVAKEYNSTGYFSGLYKAAAMEFAFRGTTAGEFYAWRKAFLPRLKMNLGIDKIESQLKGYVPVAEKKDSEDMGSFVRERWIIWTEPSVPLPVIILTPKNKHGKLPLVITPHGHGRSTERYAGVYASAEEQKQSEETDGDIAVQAVNEGYITIAPTTRAFGATRTESDKKDNVSFSCHTQLLRDLLVGRTPIGDRVWDMSKLIDWAIRHLPIDEKRIAITGQSGGGTVTLFTAVIDPRIAVAVPASYFCTFSGSIGSIAHCECNYIPGILELGEMGDVAGLVAPRPLCVINGVQDNNFPIEETRKSFAHLQDIYKAAGAAGDVMNYEGPGGHRYYKEGAWPFIKKYFAAAK